MELRVGFSTMVNQAQSNLRRITDHLAVLNQQALTGNRILEASDDPVGMVAILANQAQDNRLTMYQQNLAVAQSSLNVTVSGLQEANQIMIRAREIVIEASQSGNTSSSLEAYATEVDSLLSRMVNVANTKNQDQFLFSGTSVSSPSFVLNNTTGQYEYKGSSEESGVKISSTQTVATNLIGKDIFQNRVRQVPVYTGNTGAAGGTATDSNTGQADIQVRHSATIYAGGSGIATGTGSAGDTILGPAGANNITINDTSGTGASGTVSLNGGPAIAFSSSDTNLQVKGPNGEMVFVDTSAITAGFNGSVSITANGTLSLDGGATTTPIDFTNANQTVTDSRTGLVSNVNSTGIRQAGDTHIEYPGTFDAFQILQTLSSDLRNQRNMGSTQQTELLASRLGEVDRVRETIVQSMGQQASVQQNLDGLQTRLEDVQIETKKLLGDIQSVDLTKIVLDIQSQQNLFQLALASTAKLFDQNLLDFLQ